MRRVTTLAVIGGGTLAVVTAAAVARGRLGRRGPGAQAPDEDAMFRDFAPGGRYAYWCNRPGGWVTSKLMPIVEKGVYGTVAQMIDLQPDDELLDIGCGPGAFLATKAQHVRRVVGLDASPLMLREAERRLAHRIAAGTAQLILGNAATLPFGDGEFTAATAIFAPASPAEVFRVLHPGGRVVIADPDPAKTPSQRTTSWGLRRRDEADYRRLFEDAGFTDVTVRLEGDYLLLSCRKPVASPRNSAVGVDGQRELTGSAAPA